MEDTLKSLSMDYLNLLINGQAFSDITFNVEGRLVHANRCILAARSLFFRKFFCGAAAAADQTSPAASGALLLDHLSPRSPSGSSPRGVGSSAAAAPGAVIPVNSVSYEVFLLLLQFLYSGQISLVPQKGEPRPGCGERGCWHTHCAAAVDLAIDTLAAARSFGVEELALLTQVLLITIAAIFGDYFCSSSWKNGVFIFLDLPGRGSELLMIVGGGQDGGRVGVGYVGIAERSAALI
jgi:regulatory protein NPR1